MVKDRRYTIHAINSSAVPEQEHESDDEWLDDPDFDDPSTSRKKGYIRKMTDAQEDLLISTIMSRFDLIESKATDKSFTSKNLEKRVSKAWNEILSEFVAKTNVSV